ncbi:MAG: hypothetical protein JJ902_23260 [Roseibium sp.]|nr:hypothetical protein [Roseibium sp.]
MVASPRATFKGSPVSDSHQPNPDEIVALLNWMQSAITAGGKLATSEAELQTFQPAEQGAPGGVYGAATASENGIYTGDPGASPWWTKIADWPISFSALTNVAGTADAITADVLGSAAPGELAWIVFTPISANTGSGGETITFGGVQHGLKNGAGGNLAQADLVAGVTTMAFKDANGNFRQLVSSRAGAILDYQGVYNNGATYTQGQLTVKNFVLYYLTVPSVIGDDPETGGSGNWLVVFDLADLVLNVATAADRVFLKTVDPTTIKIAAIHGEGSRNGVLYWDPAVLVAAHSADVNETTYVAPNALADGAWVYLAGMFVGKYPSPAVRTDRDKMRDRADLRDWDGLDLTGANDEAATIQAAFNQVGPEGEQLWQPVGEIAIGSTIDVPEGLHLRGQGKSTSSGNSKYSMFHITHAGVGFTNSSNTGSRSLVGVNFKRSQPAVGPSWAPSPHDYDIKIEGGQDWLLRDLHFVNATKGIQVLGRETGAVNSGRIVIDHITGQCFDVGMDFTHCLDALYLDLIHLWPFWSADTNVTTYTRANLEAFKFGRVDNPKNGRLFTWGAFRAMSVYQQGPVGALPTGRPSKLSFDTFGADNCNVGLLINAGVDGADLRFSHLYIASDPGAPAISGENLVWLLGDNCRVNVLDLYGQYTDASLVGINGTGNVVYAARSSSTAIDNNSNGSGEFSVDAGNTLILGSEPQCSASDHYVGAGVIETPDWRDYTPTVAAQAGSLTAASATGKYRRVGKKVEFTVTATITTNGTGTGDIRVGLPFTASAAPFQGSGRETAATGNMLHAAVPAGGNVVVLGNYDNSYPGGNGRVLTASGFYEAA